MAHAEKCPVCGGDGGRRGSRSDTGSSEFVTCHGCGGKGWVEVSGYEVDMVTEHERRFHFPLILAEEVEDKPEPDKKRPLPVCDHCDEPLQEEDYHIGCICTCDNRVKFLCSCCRKAQHRKQKGVMQ